MGGVLPLIVAIFFITFLIVGLITFNNRSAKGFANSAEVVATTAMDAVAVTAPAVGILPTTWSGTDNLTLMGTHSMLSPFFMSLYSTIFWSP